jgi:hypothetical protein
MTSTRGRHRAGPSRGVRVRRVAVAVTASVGTVLAVSAFGGAGSAGAGTGAPVRPFVDAARAEGRTVPPGADEALLESAAHKVCGRREHRTTTAERHAYALTVPEIDVVRTSFGDDARGFTTLALDTYCSG